MLDGLQDIASFHSGKFAPFLPEDSQVNPGVYGAELAFWLSAQLMAKGVVTTYPESEDWGWYLEFFTDGGSEFAVHCYNVDGARDRWLLALRRHARKSFGRDKPPFQEAEPLVRGIHAVLSQEVSISHLNWLCAEAFPGVVSG